MKNVLLLFLTLSFANLSMGQHKKFDKLLKRNLENTVPIIKVDEVLVKENCLLFDAREKKEFNTSHLENAVQVGYDYFDIEKIKQMYPDTSKNIVVYCSIGIRSEHVGEKLLKAGYKNVYNLYGGIFEWKNKDQIVIDSISQPTERVHTFSKEWSKWLLKGEKVYEY